MPMTSDVHPYYYLLLLLAAWQIRLLGKANGDSENRTAASMEGSLGKPEDCDLENRTASWLLGKSDGCLVNRTAASMEGPMGICFETWMASWQIRLRF
jgi:hypothetical protein